MDGLVTNLVRSSERVPSEFVGRARQLRANLMADHDEWLAASAQLLKKVKVRPGFRRLKTKQLADLWINLPGQGAQLGMLYRTNPGELSVGELRVFPSHLRLVHWPPDALEISISLTSVALVLRGDRCLTSHRWLADVGLHALARRFQRGSDRSDEAVLHDLGSIEPGYANAIERGGDFDLAGWRGDVRIVQGERVLCVRTFVGFE